MVRQTVDKLLNALDSALNSNSFWISLNIDAANQELDQALLKHLKTGNFHHEMVKEDVYRGYYDLVEMTFAKDSNTPTFLQKPGNVWNGKTTLTMDGIEKEHARNMLLDMLTGAKLMFSTSSAGIHLDGKDATKLITTFYNELDKKGAWEVYNIHPDFLNNADDYYQSNYTKLGYFEDRNRDLALAFVFEHQTHLLLTNGYG